MDQLPIRVLQNNRSPWSDAQVKCDIFKEEMKVRGQGSGNPDQIRLARFAFLTK